MERSRWRYAWGLASIAAGGASLLVPLYVIELGAGPFALGLLSAVAALSGAVGAFAFGRVADRTARWRALGTAGLAGIVTALVAIPLVSGITLVVAANGLLWLSFSAATPVFTMLTVRNAPPGHRSRRIAQLKRIHGYGWAGGLVLGTVWTAVSTRLFAVSSLTGYRAFLGICALVGIAGVVAGGWWLPTGGQSTQRERTEGGRVRGPVVTSTFPFLPSQLFWKLRTIEPGRVVDRFTPTLAVYFVAVALFFGGFGVFFAPLPVYLSSVGYSDAMVFLLYVVAALGSAVFYGTAGELTTRYDSRLLQGGALGARGLALPLVPLVSVEAVGSADVFLLGLLFAVIGIGWAVIAVTATEFISSNAPTDVQGEALGVYTALSALAGGVGSLVGGFVAGRAGYLPAFALACLLVVVSAAVVLRPALTGAHPT